MFNWLRKNPIQERKENPVGRVMMVRPGQPAWTLRQYDKLAREAYIKNYAAHLCIYKIASSAASANIKLCRMEGDKRVDLDGSHPALKLLAQPNPMQSGDDFIHALVSFFLIGGNAYVCDNKGVELWLLNPQHMQVIEGRGGMPLAYRFSAGKGYVDYPVNQLTGKSDVLHWKDFHPIDNWYGLSKLDPAAHGVDILNDVMAWNKSLLQNNCVPPGVLQQRPSKDSASAALTDEQYNRLAVQIEERFTGTANARKPLLLEGGLEWLQMSTNPVDMDYLENYNTMARQVASVFGVPAQLLGIPGDSTYNNMAEARLIFWEDTVIPLINKMLTKLNGWLLPRFGDGLMLYLDENSIRALEPRRAEQHTRMKEAGWLTYNEKRRATGHDDMPQDFFDLPITAIPVDETGRMLEDPRAERREQGGEDDDDGGEEGSDRA